MRQNFPRREGNLTRRGEVHAVNDQASTGLALGSSERLGVVVRIRSKVRLGVIGTTVAGLVAGAGWLPAHAASQVTTYQVVRHDNDKDWKIPTARGPVPFQPA